MRGLGITIAIILGIILGFRGLYRLIKMRRYGLLIIFLVIWFLTPVGAYYLFSNIETFNSHQKSWLLIPSLFILLFWLFFGLIINKKVENIMNGINYKDDKSALRRMIGLALVVVSIIVWLIGFNEVYNLSEGLDMLGSGINTVILMFGLMYLISGKPFDKIDD